MKVSSVRRVAIDSLFLPGNMPTFPRDHWYQGDPVVCKRRLICGAAKVGLCIDDEMPLVTVRNVTDLSSEERAALILVDTARSPEEAGEKARVALALVDIQARKLDKDPPPAAYGEVRTFGLPVSRAFVADVRFIQGQLKLSADGVRRAVVCIRAIENQGCVFPAPRMARIIESALALAKALDDAAPVGLCAWCKGVKGLQESCAACMGCGWMARWQEPMTTAGLRDEAQPRVLFGNEEKLLSDVVGPIPETMVETEDEREDVDLGF